MRSEGRITTRRLCGFAEENPISGEIAHYVSVGEVPSAASALPYQRGVIKTVGPHRRAACVVHGMRMATGEKWAIFGRNAIPAMPTVGAGSWTAPLKLDVL